MYSVKVMYNDGNAIEKLSSELVKIFNDDIVIVDIGSDRCIGDSVGPLVGTILEENHFNFPFYGTCNNPIHALNICKELEKIKLKHPQATIIGIDACLGDEENIGQIQYRNYPVHPGKGVGKNLPKVGNYSIISIVDDNYNSELFINRNIRLSLILNISKVIAKSLIKAENTYRKIKNTENKEIAIN